MKYEITGGVLPVIKVNLDAGQSVFNDNGSMIWRTEHVKMDTNTRGGLLKGLARGFSGESVFMNTFTAEQSNQEVAFATNMPGMIKIMNLEGNKTIMCQKGAFLVGDQGINLDVAFTKKFSAGLLGGEGFILQKLSGTGDVALEIDGSLEEKTLGAGEVLYVDQGNLAYFDESVTYSVEMVKGFKNVVFGGEGLLLVKLIGPGNVGLQSLPLSNLAGQIKRYIPTSK
jgi:uncharacterized protein (TIGR00266 family)